MKYILLFFTVLINFSVFSQERPLIEYFFSDNFSSKTFEWQVGINEYVSSKKDQKLIISVSKKNMSNGYSIIETNYFHPFDDKIVNTVRQNSMGQGLRRISEIVIQKPNSEWSQKDGDGFNRYSSFYTSVETDYGSYADCIAVVKKFTSSDKNLMDNFGAYYTINYYAYSVGLVKIETYKTSTGKRPVQKDRVLDKQLIDKKSNYSNFVSKEQKQLRLEVDKIRQKTYSLKDYYTKKYDYFYNEYLDQVINKLEGYAKQQLRYYYSSRNFNAFIRYKSYKFLPTINYEGSARIIYTKKYNVINYEYLPQIETSNRGLKDFLNTKFDDLPIVCLEVDMSESCYNVDTEIIIENFLVELKRGVTVIKKKSNDNYLFYENIDLELQSKIRQLMIEYRKGKYIVSYQIGTLNKNPVSEIEVDKI